MSELPAAETMASVPFQGLARTRRQEAVDDREQDSIDLPGREREGRNVLGIHERIYGDPGPAIVGRWTVLHDPRPGALCPTAERASSVC